LKRWSKPTPKASERKMRRWIIKAKLRTKNSIRYFNNRKGKVGKGWGGGGETMFQRGNRKDEQTKTVSVDIRGSKLSTVTFLGKRGRRFTGVFRGEKKGVIGSKPGMWKK